MKQSAKAFGVDVHGATEAQAIDWVTTMMDIPASTNPILDETGEFAELGDVGDVHYLAGNFGGDTTRAFDVDLGDTLVIPLLNTWSDEFSAVMEDFREDALYYFESFNIQSVYLRIDLFSDGKYEYGKPGDVIDVSDATYYPEIRFKGNSHKADQFFVVPETEFVFDFPDDNIFGLDAGSSKSATTGYYVAIDGLPEGTHTIEFGGAADLGGEELYEFNITDIITVVDEFDFA